MNSDSGPGVLNWQLLRRLRTGLPFKAQNYVSPVVHKLLQVVATQANSQPEFVFFELVATMCTLSKKITVAKGPNQPLTHPNMFMNVGAAPKAGKTNAHNFGDRLRRLLYVSTGMNNDVLTGTIGGFYTSTVKCAKRGGLPLHAPDEGLASLNSILPLNLHSNFQPEVLLSKGWSGTNVARAKATANDLETEDARLTMLAVGTLADILSFHRLCNQHYANRGLLGRFLTVYAPAYSARCEFPDPDNQEEESLLALSGADLTSLLVNACMHMYRQVEEPTFQGFTYSDEALELIGQLHADEAAEQGDAEEPEQWQELLSNKLLAHVQKEFRGAEMTEKWTLVLHVLESVVNSINYVERTIEDAPPATTIQLDTVRLAQALVRRGQEQDGFFIQVFRIMASARNRETVYIAENVDFILYQNLTQLLLMWPGPVITSESFSDRCAKLGLPIPFDDVCQAAQALMDYGSVARESGDTRITCPGIFRHTRVPRQSFRFFKTHPDLLSLETLTEFGIDLKDYTWRYHMDYFQVVDANALRNKRSEKKFDEWLAEIPAELQPNSSGSSQVSTSASSSSADQPPTYRPHSKWQGESVDLRFGPALLATRRKRRHEEPEQPHTFRFPGAPSFSNTDT